MLRNIVSLCNVALLAKSFDVIVFVTDVGVFCDVLRNILSLPDKVLLRDKSFGINVTECVVGVFCVVLRDSVPLRDIVLLCDKSFGSNVIVSMLFCIVLRDNGLLRNKSFGVYDMFVCGLLLVRDIVFRSLGRYAICAFAHVSGIV